MHLIVIKPTNRRNRMTGFENGFFRLLFGLDEAASPREGGAVCEGCGGFAGRNEVVWRV